MGRQTISCYPMARLAMGSGDLMRVRGVIVGGSTPTLRPKEDAVSISIDTFEAKSIEESRFVKDLSDGRWVRIRLRAPGEIVTATGAVPRRVFAGAGIAPLKFYGFGTRELLEPPRAARAPRHARRAGKPTS